MRPPERLTADHELAEFACGREELDTWLKGHAIANEGKTSRTFVVPIAQRVVGYYCLSAGAVMRGELPRKMRHDTPQQVPVVVLGRLATDIKFAGRGIGKGMLREAIVRTIRLSEELGVRALVVHALDAEAANFYLPFNFIPYPIGDRTLLLPIETAMSALLP